MSQVIIGPPRKFLSPVVTSIWAFFVLSHKAKSWSSYTE